MEDKQRTRANAHFKGCHLASKPGNYEVSRRAEIAIKHRLYLPGWQMKQHLLKALENPELYYIELSYIDNIPVGVMLGRHSLYNKCVGGKPPEARYRRPTRCKVVGLQSFVRKAYRRQGHATAMVQRIKAYSDNQRFAACEGIEGSGEFWRSQFIKPWLLPEYEDPSTWRY